MQKPNFFDDNSPFLSHPLLTAARTMQEVNFLLSQLDLPAGAHILDVGCGFGRHSIELAQRGFDVLGLDPAAAMIAAANQRARQAGVAVQFAQMGGQAFSLKLLRLRPFQAAICLFTTLGQMSEDGKDNIGLLPKVYEALQPGGQFVIEVPQRATAVHTLRPGDQFGETAVTRHFNPHDNTITEHFTVGQTEEFLLRYRLFSREELVGLVEDVGFGVTAVLADYAGGELTADSPNMLLFLKR
jgi:SAM-dependent methyltransferase